jgi:hypothetical protein
MRYWKVYLIHSINTIENFVRKLNAKVGREDIFKPTNGNESLHEISNDNGIRIVNFPTSIKLRVINILGCLQMGKLKIRLTIF